MYAILTWLSETKNISFDLDRSHIWIITQEFQEVECTIFVHLIFKKTCQLYYPKK